MRGLYWLKAFAERALLVVLGMVVALGGAELVARALFPTEDPPTRHRDLPVLTRLSDLSAPNQHGVFKGTEIRTNSLGFRSSEHSADTAPGTFRIVLTGDSVVMGQGVEEEQSYGALLEDQLARARPGRRYEVINTGLSGTTLAQSLPRLRRALDAYSTDLVIYGFTINDIEGEHYEQDSQTEWWWQRFTWSRPLLERSRLAQVLVLRWLHLSLVLGGVTPYEDEVRANYFGNPLAWSDFVRNLEELRGMAEQASACGVVFLHAHLHELGADHPFVDVYDRVGAAALRAGLHVVPSFSYFRDRNPVELRISVLDAHPNPEGHEIFAKALTDGLLEMPKECWH